MTKLSIFNYYDTEGSLIASGLNSVDEPISYDHKFEVETEYLKEDCEKLYFIIQVNNGKRSLQGYDSKYKSAKEVARTISGGKKTIANVSYQELKVFEELIQPEPVQLELVQPEPIQPELIQPELVQLELIQPEPIQLEPVQPEPIQLEPVKVMVLEPTDYSLDKSLTSVIVYDIKSELIKYYESSSGKIEITYKGVYGYDEDKSWIKIAKGKNPQFPEGDHKAIFEFVNSFKGKHWPITHRLGNTAVILSKI
jgi:hypothetical protein